MLQSNYLSCAEAARLCPGSIKPNPATIWRWARKGVRARNGKRVCLEHVRVGAKIYIPPEAIPAFFKAIADADSEHFQAVADAADVAPPAPKWHQNCRPKLRPADSAEILNRAGIC